MGHPAVDKFGALLIRRLRDHSISHFDRLVSKQYNAHKLQGKLEELPEEVQELVRDCVISCIDAGLHDFLFGLVEAHEADGGIEVIVDGTNIADESDGLHGEQFSEHGWIERFGEYDEDGRARNK